MSPGVATVTLHTAFVLGFIVPVAVVIILAVTELVELAGRIVAGAGLAVTVSTGLLSRICLEMLAAFRLVMIALLVYFAFILGIVFAVSVSFFFLP